MAQSPPAHESPATGNTCGEDISQSGPSLDGFDVMKAPSQKQSSLPSDPFQGENTYNSSGSYFDKNVSEEASTFFDFGPQSGTVTPSKQEPFSKVPFDAGISWDGFQPLSPPDSAIYPTNDWHHFDQAPMPQMPHNILTQIDPFRARAHFGQTTPPDEDLSSSLEYQLGQQQHGLPSPKSTSSSDCTKRKTSAVGKPEAHAPPKRVRKSTARSRNSASIDPNDPDESRRSKFLERNRVAASKCRQKKKEWTQNLENKARDLQRHNQELRLIIDSCKEEILFLKEEMLKHTVCGCPSIQEYLKGGATPFGGQRNIIIKREASPEGTMPPSPGSIVLSHLKDGEGTPIPDADQASPCWGRTVEENLEALLRPQYGHDTSEEGIAKRIGSQ